MVPANLFGRYREHIIIQSYLLNGNICFYGRTGWIHTIGLNGIKKINGTL
jgi:hypothetical protein